MFEVQGAEKIDSRERRILDFWEREGIFKRSIEQRAGAQRFMSYDGPPFATGLPHYGHLLVAAIKDSLLRFKAMEGYEVPRQFGWDCHGLPVENEVEKSHGLSGAPAIETFGIPAFNEACRSIVLRHTEEWKSTVSRIGRWVDFDKTYRTMDINFMESVWWAFKQLYDKGLVYEGFRVMPYSAKLGTPLSNFEAGENYKEVDDPSLTVAFDIEGQEGLSLLIWTTTPWTLLSNMAVMVAPDVDYATVIEESSGHHYITATARLPETFKGRPYSIIKQCSGRDLAGLRYKPPFSYFTSKAAEGAFLVILDEGVSLDEGTGLVHAAPAFGEVDFHACQKAQLPLVCPVDSNGRFTSQIPDYEGLFVKDADNAIIQRLKSNGKLFRQGTCRHRYPFCYRSDTPLIYMATSTWFVVVEKFREQLLAMNDQISWVPSHIKEGRFGKWLANARDWNISRNRYWGTPIPLWRSEDGDCIAIGSRKELFELTGCAPEDLHRHFIDQITIKKGGKVYHRIPEVFDCWFESGSMPYAQLHYPFENQELFTSSFPANFIAEGVDQTRAWFYTLTLLSTMLFEKPAFKQVIVNGIVLAENGSKMSKRLKNYPDPAQILEKYGADALRLYMLNSGAVRADDLCFSESGVELVVRQVLIPWWNSYSFLATYASIYSWTPRPFTPTHILDKWLLARLNSLISEVHNAMENYQLDKAVEPLVGFIDSLTNWYIRRSRRRFWSADETEERSQAFASLHHVLIELSKLAAPFAPFIADAIYTQLRSDEMPLSVHLCNYPTIQAIFANDALVAGMDALQRTVSLGHGLRKEQKIKVRQPLPSLQIACTNSPIANFLAEHSALIADELNVKAISVHADDRAHVQLSVKPNFRLLGKKVGKQMPEVQKIITAFGQEEIQKLLEGNPLNIELQGSSYTLTSEDIEITRTVRPGIIAATEGEITILLDITLNDELLLEGLAREIINKINTMRREANFAVTDRIAVKFEGTPRLMKCFECYSTVIKEETLINSLSFSNCPEGTSWLLNGEEARIFVQVHPH